MKILEISEANEPLSKYVQDVKEEPVVLTVQGKPIAALLPIENADLETASLSVNPEFLALIERSRRQVKEQGGVSNIEIKQRLGLE